MEVLYALFMENEILYGQAFEVRLPPMGKKGLLLVRGAPPMCKKGACPTTCRRRARARASSDGTRSERARCEVGSVS